MNLLFSGYHPGPSPQRFNWPGKNAPFYLKWWFRWRNLTYPWRWRMWYRRYLKSGAWRDVRTKILDRDGYACRACGCGNSLQVHHLTYKNVGYERGSDLITLCKPCHERCHGRQF